MISPLSIYALVVLRIGRRYLRIAVVGCPIFARSRHLGKCCDDSTAMSDSHLREGARETGPLEGAVARVVVSCK